MISWIKCWCNNFDCTRALRPQLVLLFYQRGFRMNSYLSEISYYLQEGLWKTTSSILFYFSHNNITLCYIWNNNWADYWLGVLDSITLDKLWRKYNNYRRCEKLERKSNFVKLARTAPISVKHTAWTKIFISGLI